MKMFAAPSPKGTEPGQLSVVSWGRALQWYHKPTKQTSGVKKLYSTVKIWHQTTGKPYSDDNKVENINTCI